MEQAQFYFDMLFQLENKAARLNHLKSKKVKGALVWFLAVSVLTSDPVDSFPEVCLGINIIITY